MQFKAGKCADCGTAIAARHGERLCSECAVKERAAVAAVKSAVFDRFKITIPEIAAAARLPKSTVQRIVRQFPSLADVVPHEVLCLRCRKRPTVERSDYCEECRFELNLEIQAAAKELLPKVQDQVMRQLGHGTGVPGRVAESLNEKRRRASISRLDPTPKGKYSG